MTGLARRTWTGFREHDLRDRAAALTFYAVLSVFPALLVLVSIVGRLPGDAVQSLIDQVTVAAPGPAREIALDSIRGVASGGGAAGLVLVAGLAGAWWSASGYVGAFLRAAAVIRDVPDDRPAWRSVTRRLAVTLVVLLAVAAGAVAIVLTGPVAREAGDLVGVGTAAVQVWDLAKLPVLLALAAAVIGLLYRAAADGAGGGAAVRWITPGAVVAVLTWLGASALFALYVSRFGSYNATYGVLGGFVVFLLWLWISNIALLVGAELDARLADPAP
jgi:membrane protein